MIHEEKKKEKNTGKCHMLISENMILLFLCVPVFLNILKITLL